MKGHSLLFQKKGICEIRGLSVCSLIDFRFDHHLETTISIKPFTAYLFEGLTVVLVDCCNVQNSEQVKKVYKECYEIVQKCLELSFNSIKKLVKEITTVIHIHMID